MRLKEGESGGREGGGEVGGGRGLKEGWIERGAVLVGSHLGIGS